MTPIDSFGRSFRHGSLLSAPRDHAKHLTALSVVSGVSKPTCATSSMIASLKNGKQYQLAKGHYWNSCLLLPT